MEQILPISDLQHRAKKMIEMTNRIGEPIIITQNGHPAAVVMDYETYQGWKLTLEEMSEPDWKEKLKRAERDVELSRLTPLTELLKNKSTKRGNSPHKRSKK